MKLTKAERETIIRTSEDSDVWKAYTTSRQMMTKLNKLAEAKEIMEDGDGVYAKCYELPKEYLKFTKPRKLSESEKARRAGLLTGVRNTQVGNLAPEQPRKDEIKIAK